MATLQGKAVKNTYRQVLQIGANNVGVSGTLQPVQDGAGVNTALSLSTGAATINGNLTITGDLIITGGGIEIKELIDDTVAALITNGTGITWTYNDGANTLTGNFTGTTSVVPEGSNLYYTQGRFDSAFAAKSTTNLAEGTNLYFTEARGNANFATNLAASDTDDLSEGSTNLYFTNARARTALSVTAGTGLSYDNTTGVFNLAAIPNASLTNSSITINSQSVALGGSVTLTTTNIAEGTNLYWTDARFDSRFGTKTTTNLAEGTNLYYTQARFNSALAAKTTTDLAEGTNLYYTDARARLALSSSATGLSYANNSGVFSLTAGYAIPTTVKLGEYDIAYNRSIVSAAVTGTSTKTLSLTQQDANVITATWTDQGITTINGTANQIAATTVGNTTTLAFTNDVTMPNNLVVSGNLTINGTATYVNTESISSKDPLFEVANTNNTTDAVDIGYYGRYYDSVQERVEFTGLFRDASDAGKFKIFTGLVDEPTNVVNTTGTGYTVATLVANVDGNLAGTANAANILSTARTIAASGDAAWSVSFDGSANVTSALTLANTGVTATTYGTSTAVPTIAVDSKGRITSASNTNITFPVTTVNGFAGTVVLTTSDVAEGTNQYFTTARAQASITGGASSVVTANLTASRALVSDGSGKIAASATTTTTEIGYLAGVTSAIQTQLNSKLNLTGGTLTGGLIGTTGSFSSSGSGDTFTIGHTSGSGIALNITKNGNGEGLYINKASGSGNAATIIGTLNATTLVKSGGTASQFLMADGSVNTSVLASGAYLPLAGGTLTGNLNATTATFAGILNSITGQFGSKGGGSYAVLISDNDQSNVRLRFTNTGGPNTWDLVGGLNAQNNNDFSIRDVTNSVNALRIVPVTGAATFNSSVTASGFYAVAGNSARFFRASNDFYWGINNDSNNYLNFGTFAANGTAYGTNPKMILLDNGNVGIGTSSPDYPLVVQANSSGAQAVKLLGRSIDNISILSFHNNANSTQYGYIAGIPTEFRINSGSSIPITFTNADTERMRITSGGNVGIGTSSPASPLTINATAGAAQFNITRSEQTNQGFSIQAGGGETTFNSYEGTNSVFGEYVFKSTKGSTTVERMRITSNGSVCINATSPGSNSPYLYNYNGDGSRFNAAFEVSVATPGFTSIMFRNPNGNVGNIAINTSSVSYNTTSDYRLKEDLKDFSGLDKVSAIKVYDYKWKSCDERMDGVLAHELAEVLPYAVNGEKDGEQMQGVDYSKIVPVLIKSIQELETRIKQLENK